MPITSTADFSFRLSTSVYRLISCLHWPLIGAGYLLSWAIMYYPEFLLFCSVCLPMWEEIAPIQLSYFNNVFFFLPWSSELSVWPQGNKYSEQEGRQFVALCTHQDLKLQEIKFDKAWWDLVSDPPHQRDFVTNSICHRLLNTRLVSHLETLFRPSGEFKICLEAESNSIVFCFLVFFAALGTKLQ